MKILLTNDDGIHAPGLMALRDAFSRKHEVTVVAPDRQRSAIGSSITLFEPLIVRRYEEKGMPHYSVSGTPADAVKLAVRELFGGRPDVVLSGINHGLNSGSNIFYSGTVAAAFEASMFDLPAIAVSGEARADADVRGMARRTLEIVRRILPQAKRGVVYNLNFPARKPRGLLVTRQEMVIYQDSFARRQDPRGRIYYWLHGSPEEKYDGRGAPEGEGLPTDAWALANGYASLTPLHRNLTDSERTHELKALFPGRPTPARDRNGV